MHHQIAQAAAARHYTEPLPLDPADVLAALHDSIKHRASVWRWWHRRVLHWQTHPHPRVADDLARTRNQRRHARRETAAAIRLLRRARALLQQRLDYLSSQGEG